MLVSFVLSCFDRPSALFVSLGSLVNQTVGDWQCLVMINGSDESMILAHQVVVLGFADKRIKVYSRYGAPHDIGCYHSAEYGARKSTGKWLAFPSDDSYFTPEYVETMTSDDGVDLAYCDVLYDRRLSGYRGILNVVPVEGLIDKTCFMVKREKFIGFPDKDVTPNADGKAIEQMIRLGYKHRKVGEALCIHN